MGMNEEETRHQGVRGAEAGRAEAATETLLQAAETGCSAAVEASPAAGGLVPAAGLAEAAGSGAVSLPAARASVRAEGCAGTAVTAALGQEAAAGWRQTGPDSGEAVPLAAEAAAEKQQADAAAEKQQAGTPTQAVK